MKIRLRFTKVWYMVIGWVRIRVSVEPDCVLDRPEFKVIVPFTHLQDSST